MNEQDYCIVNIWTSERNKVIPGNNWGHVSLETNLGYYSLWPAPRTEEARAAFQRARDEASPKERREMEGKRAKLLESRPPFFIKNYEEDLAAKGYAEPEVRIAFYHLNPGRINQCFVNELRPIVEKSGWRLIGSNILSRMGNSSESCASLAYRLLLAGGLHELVNPLQMSIISSKNSSAVEPDKCVEQILLAKSQELHKYPATKNLSIEGQSDVEALIRLHKVAGKTSLLKDQDTSFSSFRKLK